MKFKVYIYAKKGKKIKKSNIDYVKKHFGQIRPKFERKSFNPNFFQPLG